VDITSSQLKYQSFYNQLNFTAQQVLVPVAGRLGHKEANITNSISQQPVPALVAPEAGS